MANNKSEMKWMWTWLLYTVIIQISISLVFRSLRHWRNKLIISHDGLKEIVTRQFCEGKNISEMCNFKIMINRKALLPTIDTFTNTSIHCALEPFVASTAVWPTRVLACAVLTASGEEAAFVCVWKKNSLSWKLASTRDSVWQPLVCIARTFVQTHRNSTQVLLLTSSDTSSDTSSAE